MKIDGRKIRDEILGKLNPPKNKFLAAVIVGEDPSSVKFIEEKKKIADKLGIIFNLHSFPGEIYEEELRFNLEKIWGEESCGGVLVQLPLPKHISPEILSSIPPEKDPDALGRAPLVLSPAVLAAEEILKRQKIDPELNSFVVLGHGYLVGKPIASWLRNEAKKLLVLDKGDGLGEISEADVVISGTGQAKLFSAKQLKPGAGVIDFGTSFVDGKISGDFDPDGAEKISFYTPTPGGTGPILIAKLYQNFCELNKEKTG